MKQNRNRIIRLAMAALLLTTGCTKEAESPAGAAYSDVQILAASELAEDNVVVVPQSETRAAADPMQAMTFYLVRADEMGKGIGTYGAYSTTPLPATRVAGTGAQALAFATKQYYLASNAKTKLTGWYPAETSLTGSVVSWTINGATDILTAAEQAGNMGSPMPNLVFNHSLAQVQIHAYAPDANARDTWGTISKIELVEQTNTCTYDFSANAATGTVTPKSGTTGTFAVGNIAGATIPVVTAAQVGDPVMIAPQTAAAVLKLEVTTSKCGKVAVSMPAGVYEARKAYILKLKFNPYTIDATASIGTWQTVDRSEQEVVPSLPPVAIGDAKDGGIVYWVDPADDTKYKVVALTDSNAEAANKTMKWAASTSYEIGSGAQSDTDGRANVAAIKSAFDNKMAGVAITESSFEEAFPAAAYCYNYKGKDGNDPVGTWYLPAKTELQYLWCAFNGKAPAVSWVNGTNSSAPANAAAQGVFNGYLTTAGGTPILNSDYFWSSTELSYGTYYAWYVYFSTGFTYSNDKDINYTNFVRCVRAN